jgi:orotate phosphoribosyltransferase
VTDDVLNLFTQAGAYLKGHFLLTSGRHSDVYFEKFMLLAHPNLLEDLCSRLARLYKDTGVHTVLGPTLGGAIIAYELARQLDCRAVYAEEEEGRRVLRRGFKIEAGERVLICDDILTTGRSVNEVIALAESCRAEIAGIALLLDRSGGKVSFTHPYRALTRVDADAYEPATCPLCLQGVPLTKRGSRKEIA